MALYFEIRSPIPEKVNRRGELLIMLVSMTTPNGMVEVQLTRLPSTRRLAPGAAKPSLEIAVGTAITGRLVRNPAYLPKSTATPPPTATMACASRGSRKALD